MLKFTKIQGAGNDFILIDDRTGSFSLGESEIRRLCHRHFGIGADGLILLQKEPVPDPESFYKKMPLDFSAGQSAEIESNFQKVNEIECEAMLEKIGSDSLKNFHGRVLDIWRMRIFNSDGRETEGCGNGLRCLGRFLLELGLPLKNTPVRVGDRIVEISYIGDKIGVDMGEPRDLSLHIATEKGIVHFVDTGVPHVVHFMDAIEHAPLDELGPFWRRHPRFAPRGTNVNLAALEEGRIRVRTFERGVEGETLACGTGACAVALVAHAVYSIPSPIAISFPGGELEIQIEQNRLMMIGPAVKVFEGSLCV